MTSAENRNSMTVRDAYGKVIVEGSIVLVSRGKALPPVCGRVLKVEANVITYSIQDDLELTGSRRSYSYAAVDKVTVLDPSEPKPAGKRREYPSAAWLAQGFVDLVQQMKDRERVAVQRAADYRAKLLYLAREAGVTHVVDMPLEAVAAEAIRIGERLKARTSRQEEIRASPGRSESEL